MNRPHFETRSRDQAESRAIVIDAAIARTIVWLAGTAIAASVAIGLWIGVTVQGFNSRIKGVETDMTAMDAQIASLQTSYSEQNRRITALEITITGIGALKERVDAGFSEIAKRLDRMEDADR